MPSGRRTLEHVLAREVQHLGQLADRLTLDGADAETDQLVVVELVGVLGPLGGVDLGDEQDASQALGRTAVVVPLEVQQEAAGVDPAVADRQRAGRGRVGPHRRPRGQPALRVVGADIDRDVALDPVRPPDPADDDLHA